MSKKKTSLIPPHIKLLGALIVVGGLSNGGAVSYSKAIVMIKNRVNEMTGQLTQIIKNSHSMFSSKENYNKLKSTAIKDAYMARAENIILLNRQVIDQVRYHDPLEQNKINDYANIGHKTANSVLNILYNRPLPKKNILPSEVFKYTNNWLSSFGGSFCKAQYSLIDRYTADNLCNLKNRTSYKTFYRFINLQTPPNR